MTAVQTLTLTHRAIVAAFDALAALAQSLPPGLMGYKIAEMLDALAPVAKRCESQRAKLVAEFTAFGEDGKRLTFVADGREMVTLTDPEAFRVREAELMDATAEVRLALLTHADLEKIDAIRVGSAAVPMRPLLPLIARADAQAA